MTVAMRQISVAAASVVLVVALVGSAWTLVDRDSYVAANKAVLAELPTFPGSDVISVRSSSYSGGDSAWSPPIGYVTTQLVALPANATPEEVAAFFERELRPEWTLVEKLSESQDGGGPVLNFRRGSAFLSVNLESWRAGILEVAVDHGAF